MGTRASSGHVDRVAAVLRSGLRAAYQPVVHLESGAVLGYEALARVPQGAPTAAPLELFAEARATGRSVELDWACRAAAIRGALDADLGSSLTLFVNVEPDTDPADPPTSLLPLLEEPDEYDFAVTHDRALVIEAGRALLRNVPVGTTSL